jgi:hypothetical protein
MLLLLFFSIACTAKRHAGDVDVAELFGRPDYFNGRRVSVIGYYVSGMEESGLYTSPTPQASPGACHLAKNDDVFGCDIWVDPGWRRVSRLTNRYVRVVGVFHYRPEATRRNEKRPDGREFESVITEGYGHFGLYPAELSDVTSFRPLR